MQQTQLQPMHHTLYQDENGTKSELFAESSASLAVARWIRARLADAEGRIGGRDLEYRDVNGCSIKVEVRCVADDGALLVDGGKVVALHGHGAVCRVAKPIVDDLFDGEVAFEVVVLSGHAVLCLWPKINSFGWHRLLEHSVCIAVFVDEPSPAASVRVRCAWKNKHNEAWFECSAHAGI